MLSAAELASAYRRRDLSPVEATRVSLAQIEAHDPAVNAFCLVDARSALAQARDSEARWASGQPLSPLDGVPAGVKDIFLTDGWPTRRGSKLIEADGPWTEDAPAVAALRRAGVVMVGKTTTPELAWKAVTDSPLAGITRNPWDPALTAGGSSGGSSAALALGMVALALGTDGGGSIRIPASFCGHPGLKPTHGRVPLWPVSPFGPLAHAGPMARTVGDVALLLDALSVYDPRDPTGPPSVSPVAGDLEASLQGLRVAFSTDLGWARVDPEVASVVGSAAAIFEDLGATVEERDPGFDDPLEAFVALWDAGVASALAHVGPDRHHLLDPGLRRAVEHGNSLSAVAYLAAVAERGQVGVCMGRFHTDYDLLVTPAVAVAPFAAGQDVPPGWPDARWPTWASLSYPFNLTQQPAASVPCGFTAAGLPVGMQIVGRRHADALVLRAAAAYERTNPTSRRPSLLDGVEPGRSRGQREE